VLVKNSGAERLLMVNVLFLVEEPSGKVLRYSFNNENFSGPTSRKGIAPGESHFVSMFPQVNVAVQSRSLAVLSASLISDSLTTAKRYRSIGVSLDSIVTESGLFLGPDSIGAFSRIQQQQRAISEACAAIRALKDDPEKIPTYLSALAATVISPPRSPVDRDFFNERKRTLGNMLQQVYAREGAEGVIRFAGVPRVTVHK
jgi:hypothetical protein